MAEFLILNSVKFNIDVKHPWSGRTAFHWACAEGNSNIAEMIIQKSTEFNIDLNAKDKSGRTAFHWACLSGHGTKSSIMEMMLNNGESFKIDFTATDNMGKTGLQLAEDEDGKMRWGRNANIVNMIKRKMESIAQEEELKNRNKKSMFTSTY